MFAVVLIGMFAVGALAFVTLLVVGVVRRVRGKDDGEWQDDRAEDAPPNVRPGPGWGNGGSWN